LYHDDYTREFFDSFLISSELNKWIDDSSMKLFKAVKQKSKKNRKIVDPQDIVFVDE
jgi:hypothetical protein